MILGSFALFSLQYFPVILDLIFFNILLFIFLTISYAFFNKYFDSPPHLCVRCYDRHIEKGNPCSWFLKSKYENKLNVTLLYTALTTQEVFLRI